MAPEDILIDTDTEVTPPIPLPKDKLLMAMQTLKLVKSGCPSPLSHPNHPLARISSTRGISSLEYKPQCVLGTTTENEMLKKMNLVEQARYQNVAGLIECMTSVWMVHERLCKWVQQAAPDVGERTQWLFETFDEETDTMFQEARKLNDLSEIENIINRFRQSLLSVLAAYDRLQAQIGFLMRSDKTVDSTGLVNLDIDWLELQRGRDSLPAYSMLGSKAKTGTIGETDSSLDNREGLQQWNEMNMMNNNNDKTSNNSAESLASGQQIVTSLTVSC